MRIGIHTFTAGSLERAAQKAAELGANTFQIFSSSPRMWRSRLPDPEQVRLLREVRRQHDLRPMAIHANYLINLASFDPVIRAKSIEAFRGELERAAAIGAEYVVLHPGSYKDRTLVEGIDACAKGLREACASVQTSCPTILLENTAGSGASIGSRFEELAAIRDQVTTSGTPAIGYCLDTCHLLASGFEIRTANGLASTVRALDAILRLENVHLIHANDSKTGLGSRVDRHAHIGEGHIGLEAFGRILRHPKLRSKPFILETPVEKEGDDRRNLNTLKLLAASGITTAPRV